MCTILLVVITKAPYAWRSCKYVLNVTLLQNYLSYYFSMLIYLKLSIFNESNAVQFFIKLIALQVWIRMIMYCSIKSFISYCRTVQSLKDIAMIPTLQPKCGYSKVNAYGYCFHVIDLISVIYFQDRFPKLSACSLSVYVLCKNMIILCSSDIKFVEHLIKCFMFFKFSTNKQNYFIFWFNCGK